MEAMLAHSQTMVTLRSAAHSVAGDIALTNVAHTGPSAQPVLWLTQPSFYFIL